MVFPTLPSTEDKQLHDTWAFTLKTLRAICLITIGTKERHVLKVRCQILLARPRADCEKAGEHPQQRAASRHGLPQLPRKGRRAGTGKGSQISVQQQPRCKGLNGNIHMSSKPQILKVQHGRGHWICFQLCNSEFPGL